MNLLFRLLLATLALTLVTPRVVFAGTDSCETVLTEHLPDLDAVGINFTAYAVQDLDDLGYSPAWITDRIRASVRAPSGLESDGRRPHYVVYVVTPPLALASVRVVFLWTDEHKITVVNLTRHDLNAESDEYARVMRYAPLRRARHRYSMTDVALGQLWAARLSSSDLDEAKANGVAKPVHSTERLGYQWSVGDRADQPPLSIQSIQLPGIEHVLSVREASLKERSHFITSSGLEHSSPDADLIAVTRGPYAKFKVRFAPGIEQKIKNIHHLGRDEVIESLERSVGYAPDRANKTRTDSESPRWWFVTPLTSGRLIKVVFVFPADDEIWIITSFETDGRVQDGYLRYLNRKLPRRRR